MHEKTFILIKPDHVKVADEILSHLDSYGSRILSGKVDSVSKEVIEEHYAPHKEKYFFHNMTRSFIGNSVILAVYEGEEVIQKFINLIGPTDPSKAQTHTIRGKYGNDSIERAEAEKRSVKNVIHRSDSSEEAEREIKVWEKHLVKKDL